jgi:hypothetical protein
LNLEGPMHFISIQLVLTERFVTCGYNSAYVPDTYLDVPQWRRQGKTYKLPVLTSDTSGSSQLLLLVDMTSRNSKHSSEDLKDEIQGIETMEKVNVPAIDAHYDPTFVKKTL